MKLLVIGSGGREHALAWKLAQSPRVAMVFVAPGNGGTATEAGLENVDITKTAPLIEFVRREGIHLTVVGPEAPLAAGVVDAFQDAGLRIFGPTRAAAQLEASKDFAKQFMVRHGIPTARHATFESATEAKAYVERQGAPIVVKADGLAAGKGVIIAATEDEANAAIDDMLAHGRFGAAGAEVVVEEFLDGEEASFLALADGATAIRWNKSRCVPRAWATAALIGSACETATMAVPGCRSTSRASAPVIRVCISVRDSPPGKRHPLGWRWRMRHSGRLRSTLSAIPVHSPKSQSPSPGSTRTASRRARASGAAVSRARASGEA